MEIRIGDKEIPARFVQDVLDYCTANGIADPYAFFVKILRKGFDLEKWGHLQVAKAPEPKPEPVKETPPPAPEPAPVKDKKPPVVAPVAPVRKNAKDLYGE